MFFMTYLTNYALMPYYGISYSNVLLFCVLWLFSVISPIDGKSMESIISVKIFHGSEFKANGKVIRWTEVRR